MTIAFALGATAAFSQSTRLNDSCDLAALDANDTKAFLAFDKQLRTAISKQDVAAITLMVDQSLRVGDRAGYGYYLNDPASVQVRFQEVFTPAVRETILKQPVEKIFCDSTGVRYGDTGVVWVHPSGDHFVIGTVNLAAIPPWPKGKPIGTIEFVCETDVDRIVIDTALLGKVRYRAWKKPRPLTEKPDVVISSGDEAADGTGTCAYPIWTFANDADKVVAMGLGCFPEVPKNARGTVTESPAHGPSAEKWCF